jgi:DNA (cytosine-5)-methyltransferase 1
VYTLNFIDLFAGAGGLSEGFIRAGYTPLAHIEMDKYARDTFQVIFSANLQKNKGKDYFVKYFAPIEKAKLQMPQKYLPKQEFLEWHLDYVFEKSSNFITC